MLVKEITTFWPMHEIANTDIWLYTQGCSTLFPACILLSHNINFLFLCLAPTASAPHPLSFSESKGRGHQTLVPDFHLSVVILCAYTMHMHVLVVL